MAIIAFVFGSLVGAIFALWGALFGGLTALAVFAVYLGVSVLTGCLLIALMVLRPPAPPLHRPPLAVPA